ncbi:hypothetical protein HD554DRAFT_1507085 [Boletus coccyginus]|nr:hypothetical protein HD554DRAFT_1507085 [Boletus coccyginus]
MNCQASGSIRVMGNLSWVPYDSYRVTSHTIYAISFASLTKKMCQSTLRWSKSVIFLTPCVKTKISTATNNTMAPSQDTYLEQRNGGIRTTRLDSQFESCQAGEREYLLLDINSLHYPWFSRFVSVCALQGLNRESLGSQVLICHPRLVALCPRMMHGRGALEYDVRVVLRTDDFERTRQASFAPDVISATRKKTWMNEVTRGGITGDDL